MTCRAGFIELTWNQIILIDQNIFRSNFSTKGLECTAYKKKDKDASLFYQHVNECTHTKDNEKEIINISEIEIYNQCAIRLINWSSHDYW